MNKIENLFEQSINKAIELVECMTDINQKATVCAQIAQALAIVIDKNGTSQTSVPECKKESDTSISTSSTPTTKTTSEKWAPPLDENGIPYLPEEFTTDPQKIIAYNKAMKDPKVKELKKKIEEEQAKKILDENNVESEDDKKEIKAKEADTKNGIKKKEIKKDVNKKETPKEIEVAPEILEKFEMYKEHLDYEQDPTFLDEMLNGITSGVETSITTMPKEMIKVLVSFLDDKFEEKFNKLEQYKESLGAEYLNELLTEMYGEECNIDEHVGYINIIQFIEYIDKAYAKYCLDMYTDENGEYYIATEDLNSYAAEYLQDKDATLEYINEENIVGYIDYLNNL